MDRKVLQTSAETRRAIVTLHTRGLSNAEVARQLGVSTRTVWLWVRRYRSTASLKDSPRAGRPRGTTPRQDRVIAEAIKADPFTTAVDIKQEHNLPCSVQTIRNRMHALRRTSHAPVKPGHTKDKPTGASIETAPPCPPPLLSFPASSSLTEALTTPVKKEFDSDAETSPSPSNSSSSITSSSWTVPHSQKRGEEGAPNCRISRIDNEIASVKAEPLCEDRPEWATVWIKKEEEDNDYKVEVEDEAVEAEYTAVTPTDAQGINGCTSGSGRTLNNSERRPVSPSADRRRKCPRLAPPEADFPWQKATATASPQQALEAAPPQGIPLVHSPEEVCPSPASPAVLLSDTEDQHSIVLLDPARESPTHIHSDSEESEGSELHPEGSEAFPFRDIFLDSDSSSIESEDEEARAGPPPPEEIVNVMWNWVKGDFVPDLFPFDASGSGVSSKVKITEGSSELDCFMHFFDTPIMGLISRETNKQYHFITKKQNLLYVNGWQDVTLNELYLFLGLCMAMPHISNGDKSDFWSSLPGIQAPFLFRFMPEARYKIIAKMLHFSSNSVRLKDPLAKIRPVYKHLKKRFKEVLHPFRNIVIDESQLLFKSRLAFRHSIPTKEHDYEAKTYVLCDCKTGFIMDFLIYSSRATEGASHDPHGTSGAIVKRLLEPLYGRGHTLFVGGWCTSAPLFHYLLTKRVGACGIMKADCRYCPQFEYVPRGSNVQYHANNVLAVRWHHRTKKKHLLSTVHGCDGSKVNKPQPFTDFISNTKRLGISDTQIFFAEMKEVKWYKKLFYHLLDIAILNSYILFVLKTGTRPLYQTFHRRLIRQIFERFGGEAEKPKLKPLSDESLPLRFLLSKGHFARLLIEKEDKKEVQKSCYVCANTTRRPKKQKATCYYCSVCEIPLCIVPCFEKYHTIKEF